MEDEEFYFLIPLWMQKYVKKEKRYRLINFICLLAVYKKLIGTGRVLGTRILRYAFRFLAIHKEQKIYSVFSINLDMGPHTASVTSKITENSLVTDICQ